MSPFLLPPEDPQQGKPINGIPLLFMSQTFTRPRLSQSWLMASVAFSDLSCEQDPKTQSTLCMTTNTISQRVAMLSQLSAILSNHPTLAFSHILQMSVLYICISFVALHIGSLLPSF